MEKANILIVEDETIVALDIKSTLTGLGYPQPQIVTDGESALNAVLSGFFDLILMDIRLPGAYDGIQTAEIIRRSLSIPLIFLSTYADDETIERARLAEPYGYILKTAHRRELHSAIQVALYRNRGERVAREREELVSSTLSSIEDAVIRTDRKGTIVAWDGGAEEMFGRSAEDAIGTPFSYLCPGEVDFFSDWLSDGSNVLHSETVIELGSGKRFPAALRISPVRKQEEAGSTLGFTLVIRDISEQKLVEKTVLEVSAKERMRIGQDLHDSLGQQLTGISLRLKAVEQEILSASPEIAREIAYVNTLVGSAIHETKSLSRRLMPPVLERYGLGPALEALAVTDSELYSIDIRCKVSDETSIGDEFTESQLYRIAQEALTNAARHSGASHVDLSLVREAGTVALEISDDGRGLPGDSEGAGLGLDIMQYRANAIGAVFSISEHEGGGLRITCRLRTESRNEK